MPRSPWSAFVILPAFAFSATGVAISLDFSSREAAPIFAGIVVALVIGKPLGILAASSLAVAAKVAIAPEGVSKRQFLGAACLCGIGDTMALLMADRALSPSESAVAKLAVLTGDLRSQYQKDLSQGGIVDTYKQVSATTSYEVVDVGLVQIDDAQDAATLVVFGQYVVKSANSGTQQAPQGSECTVTSDGAQSCTQTVQLHEVKVHGDWKIDDVSLKTTS